MVVGDTFIFISLHTSSVLQAFCRIWKIHQKVHVLKKVIAICRSLRWLLSANVWGSLIYSVTILSRSSGWIRTDVLIHRWRESTHAASVLYNWLIGFGMMTHHARCIWLVPVSFVRETRDFFIFRIIALQRQKQNNLKIRERYSFPETPSKSFWNILRRTTILVVK